VLVKYPLKSRAQGNGLKILVTGLNLDLGRSVGAVSLCVAKTYGFTIG
jgi:hypothetical protein